MQDTIVMESNPDLACNTYELYRYMRENNVFPGFKYIWLVNNPEKYKSLEDDTVTFISIVPTGFKEKMRKYKICNRAKLLIDCNRHYRRYKTSRKQINVYLDHGSPLKDMVSKYRYPLDYSFDYIISQAEFFNPYLLQQYKSKNEQIYVGGVPRNDQFFKADVSLSSIYPDIEAFKKIIVWVPTFRKIKDNGRVDCVSDLPLGMPVMYSDQDILKLEEKLNSLSMLLIIKPHPAQDLSVLKKLNCKNIRILYNEDMLDNSVQTNELLKQCDAMVTDYSGIYYDYLLLDRPIGITLDDYEEYKKQKGFVFDNEMDVLKGYYIYNLSDMIGFIDSVNDGIDEHLDERTKIKKMTNDFCDGYSSKRVCDFIVKKYREKWNK